MTKDCIEDLRFYPTGGAGGAEASQIVKGGCAELYVYTDVEPVTL